MPMPVGGAFAIRRMSGGGFGSQFDTTYDPELEDYRGQQRFMQENVKCNLKFFRSAIPANGGKLEGVLVLESQEDVEHSGIFILMKGLPPGPKKKQAKLPPQSSNTCKFTVVGSTYGTVGEDGAECMQIEAKSLETYPLELKMPDELPPPLITAEGRLIYRMQVFISTVEGRHVAVGEVPIRWNGSRALENEEVEKILKLEQQVVCKRGYMGLGKKRSAQLEWRIDKGGYLPGEWIHVEVLGESKDKGGLEVGFQVELVQKVWYQVPSSNSSRGGKMWVKMKVNVVGTGGSGDNPVEVEGEGSKLLWRGRLQVPRGITPTFKFDFTNSVSYTIRVSSGVSGESRDGWEMGEVPVLIGSRKNEKKKEAEGGEDEEGDEEEFGSGCTEECSSSRGSTSPVPQDGIDGRRGSAEGAVGGGPRRSQSMSFMQRWARPRAGSVSSMESLISSTLSIFTLPPSYSQLSSRRPTLETLPPAYGDLDWQDVEGSPTSGHESEHDNDDPSMSSEPGETTALVAHECDEERNAQENVEKDKELE